MKLGVRYETTYRYPAPVHFGRHELRLFPRGDAFTRILRQHFETNETARVHFCRDAFDNCVAACSYPEPATELYFRLELDLALVEKNPFDFLLAPDAIELPFAYSPELARPLAPFRKPIDETPLPIPGWHLPNEKSPRPTVATLVELNERLHKCVGYERREEGPAYAPAETLRLGRGACRDVALLLATVLRQMGLAARLTSGFLREAAGESGRAEGSLHAWTEVFLPGAGWIGLDATNGIFCNHNFITAAVGIAPGDITPIDGSFFHRGLTNAAMSARLELVRL